MYNAISQWIDSLPLESVSEEVVAFCFILYDNYDNLNWSMDLVGASRFDLDDQDWPCDEAAVFGLGDERFCWEREAEWDVVLDEVAEALKLYLSKGKYAHVLNGKRGVAAGFDDGDLVILKSE